MANKLTEVRSQLEATFTARMGSVVSQVIRFTSEYGIPFDSPDLDITTWLRIDPMGGPVRPHATAGRWKMTRKFRVVFNLPARNMDIAQLEPIELAVLGCLQVAANAHLGLSYVTDVRPSGADYALFEKKDPANDDDRGEMWVGVGQVEVDLWVTKAEVLTWAPAAT